MIRKTSLLCLLAIIGACTEPEPAAPMPEISLSEVPAPGVPLGLAQQRVQSYDNVRYVLQLDIPQSLTEPVTGVMAIHLDIIDSSHPLVLDFRAPEDHTIAVQLDGEPVDYSVPRDHIVIPTSVLSVGAHTVRIQFRASDAALNRQNDFMYALFVPDRASTAMPVFEQPDIKARFSLQLSVPSVWQALSNGAQISRESVANARDVLHFTETRPISTYLFSFAAGILQVETAERDGRSFTMYHRETDLEKLRRNRDAIFDLHATALAWLEDYTGLPYPFDKFDFFAVPAFQFGGMEHPGAIWYRAESLFLDPTATRTQELGRASLIAHEIAHMWFGDLVTMQWFNDVWMKEVFANFMAAKIAGPAFPDLDLDLRFFQAHHPTAYNVDRTDGTNPIRQSLDNLNDAGSMYGAIIYQKAPIVIQQLEALIGEQDLRTGLRLYLQQFPFGNATWTDLISILDTISDEDLLTWSQVWVNETGRPRITTQWQDGGIAVRQTDSISQRGLLWNQPIMVAVSVAGEVTQYRVQLQSAEAFIPLGTATEPEFIIAGADGVGYGRFVLDDRSRSSLLMGIHDLQNPIHRAVVWQTLWEEVLDGSLAATAFADAAIMAVQRESDELVAQQVLGVLRNAYWQYLPDVERRARSSELEAALWKALANAPTAGRKGAYFNTLVSVTLSDSGIARLQRIWSGEETPEGLPLQEQQYIALAEALALRNVADAAIILDTQEQRISNPDRLARLKFIRPALGADNVPRESLFETFADVTVRRRESWILDAMQAIHHPIRNEVSLPLLRDSLNLTEEIQRTGDIFFPLNWLNATLGGYRSPQAASIVRQYLADNPDLPPRLRGKVLQASDDLFRLARF